MSRKSRRGQKKWPAIDPTLNLKTRYEEITDIASYFHTLPEDAKEFMHSFVEETINAKFDHKGKKIYTKVKDKRAIYNRNNARNRDILTKAKASGKYIPIDDPVNKKLLLGHYNEDIIISKIDSDNEKKNRRKK